MSLKGNERLVDNLREVFKEIFENSEQGVYIYINDLDKLCNKNFAELLGYESVSEWENVEENFPTVFLHNDSRQALVSVYQKAMEKHVGSSIDITWRRKDGGSVRTNVILVPFPFEGHLLALHYVSKK